MCIRVYECECVCMSVCMCLCVCVWIAVADGCIILITLDDDASQCCSLLYVCICAALLDTFLVEKVDE